MASGQKPGKSRLRRLVGWVLKAALWLLAVVLAAVLALPLWIGPVATGIANRVVPGITKTSFHLGGFYLNPYTGRMGASDMQLCNPERFWREDAETSAAGPEEQSAGALGKVLSLAGKAADSAAGAVKRAGAAFASSETNAVAFSSLSVCIDPLSVCSSTVRIREIVLRDLYVYGDLTFANIREIVRAAAPPADEEAAEAEPTAAEPAGEGQSGGGKKVVIERLLVTGAKIQWGHVAVPLPDIEIKGIGETAGGTSGSTPAQAWQAAVDGVCAAADRVCAGAGKALKLAIAGGDAIGKVAGAAGDAIGAAAGAAGDAIGAAGDALGAAAGAAMKLFK